MVSDLMGGAEPEPYGDEDYYGETTDKNARVEVADYDFM